MRTIFLSVIFFLLFSCSSKKKIATETISENSLPKSALHISIKALDLSEDGAKFFTNNDEIIFLGYAISSDSNATPALITSQYFVFDSLNRNVNFLTDSFAVPSGEKFCFAMIEIDDDKTKEQIEPVVRLNLKNIDAAYRQKNLKKLSTYFGDNDVLGIIYVSGDKEKIKKENPAFIYGENLFDTYKYQLNFGY